MTYQYITEHNSPNFTPSASVKKVYGMPRTIQSITIHWWGDPNQKPTFGGTVAYLCRKGGTSSAHEVIEAGRVAPIVNHADAAWHAGNATGNATSIGLELNPRCSNEDYETAGERIADLWKHYGKLPLIPHKDWKATQCPGNYDLGRLRKIAEKYYAGGSAPAPAPVPPVPSPVPDQKEDNTMLVVLNGDTNEALLVNGPGAVRITGWENFSALAAVLPSVRVTTAQFVLFVEKYL